jgi:murein DD-endopeptidase MepM/ murein hydrolase activator NlpD
VKRLVILVPLAVLLLPILILLLVSTTPVITLDPSLTIVGSLTPVKLHVEGKHGIRRLTVFLDQNGVQYKAAETTQPTTRVFWHAAAPADLTLAAGSKTTPALKDGKATLTVEAVSNDFRGSTATVVRDVTVITAPPFVTTDGDQHYINQGGSESVLINPSGYWTETGVKVGKYSFRSFPMPGGKPGRFALYAFPWDLSEDIAPEVFARNPSGAEATAHFSYKLFPKAFRKRDLTLGDAFLQRVDNEIDPGGSGDLLTRFLKINREFRKQNNQTLADLRLKTEERFLWTEPFEQQPNSKVESVFADVRSYIYKDKKVDEQVHLGFDLSVTQHVAVQASNDGKIVYAGRLGIYGNCVVIDHGYGLQSIYGHLSQIDVKVGDSVKKRQVIGRSGSTGLAGGDHLHFSMQLDGVQINPVEWWDRHWIKDHVWKRLGMSSKP